MKTKLKIKYLEKSILDMVKAFNLPKNQSILNFGKRYDAFSPAQNDEHRVLNIRAALKYLIFLYETTSPEKMEEKLAFLEEIANFGHWKRWQKKPYPGMTIDEKISQSCYVLMKLIKERKRQHSALLHLWNKLNAQ